MLPISSISPITSIISFVLGMPTAFGIYYQAWKARREAQLARQGYLFSANCLEFVLQNGDTVNVIPLESLHTLPKPGDVVLLPSNGLDNFAPDTDALPGAYRVDRIEHIFARVDVRGSRPKQARLVKAVAHIDSL